MEPLDSPKEGDDRKNKRKPRNVKHMRNSEYTFIYRHGSVYFKLQVIWPRPKRTSFCDYLKHQTWVEATAGWLILSESLSFPPRLVSFFLPPPPFCAIIHPPLPFVSPSLSLSRFRLQSWIEARGLKLLLKIYQFSIVNLGCQWF